MQAESILLFLKTLHVCWNVNTQTTYTHSLGSFKRFFSFIWTCNHASVVLALQNQDLI